MERSIIERLRGTAACDAEGRPLVLCHGTPFEFGSFSVTTDIGFHFGTEEQARKRERDKRRQTELPEGASWTWRIRKAALAASKVLVYADDPLSWTNWSAVVGLCRRADPSFLRVLKEEGFTDPKAAAMRVRDRLLELGYDAIAYRNLYESRSGAASDWSWIALRPECVVDLPASAASIDEPVGDPGSVALPMDTRDIPGARNRSGSVRYGAQRAALDAAMSSAAAARGWTQESKAGSFRPAVYAIEAAGLPGRAELQPDIGRLAFMLHPDMEAACDMTADDFVTFTGLGKHPYAKPACLGFQWQPGESAEDFVARSISEIDHVAAIHEETAAPAFAP